MLNFTQENIIIDRASKYETFLTNWYKKEKPESVSGPETSYTKNLAQIIGGKLEVRCMYGKIDLLTDDLVIEAKIASSHSNKSAIGQALVYNNYFPNHTPAIALINKPFDYFISEICSDLGILYFYFWNDIWQLDPYL